MALPKNTCCTWPTSTPASSSASRTLSCTRSRRLRCGCFAKAVMPTPAIDAKAIVHSNRSGRQLSTGAARGRSSGIGSSRTKRAPRRPAARTTAVRNAGAPFVGATVRCAGATRMRQLAASAAPRRLLGTPDAVVAGRCAPDAGAPFDAEHGRWLAATGGLRRMHACTGAGARRGTGERAWVPAAPARGERSRGGPSCVAAAPGRSDDGHGRR